MSICRLEPWCTRRSVTIEGRCVLSAGQTFVAVAPTIASPGRDFAAPARSDSRRRLRTRRECSQAWDAMA